MDVPKCRICNRTEDALPEGDLLITFFHTSHTVMPGLPDVVCTECFVRWC